MAGKKVASRGKGKGKASAASRAIPDVYQELLAEVLPSQSEVFERPLKKRRIGRRDLATPSKATREEQQSEDEDDIEFEDVPLPGTRVGFEDGDSDVPAKPQQTAYRDSDEEDSGSDLDWDAIDFSAQAEDEGNLQLTFTARPTSQKKAIAPRRRAVSKEEKALRLQIHKMHILCLLAYVKRRNDWCNDPEVQNSLKSLLTKKMLNFLRPREDLTQFSRAESLKRGLDDVAKLWRTRFNITARGLRRPLWADDEKDLQNYHLPNDADQVIEKSDFRAAAKSLDGSRDLGAHLYCALLRSVGVEARLVCSLQVLSFTAGGPSMPRNPIKATKSTAPVLPIKVEQVVEMNSDNFVFASPNPSDSGAPPLSARRRLGHPNAAAYSAPVISMPSRPPPRPKTTAIHESPYPIFWIEVLDEAHQKWLPVDPLVTETISKSHAFEPPASDRENAMSYVVAFEDEGFARDVTHRYTKAYNAKTRKTRVECTPGGEKWWRKTKRALSRGWKSDLDQIEDNELATLEAREPMPKNVADFKDHPYYALERHLRRNEILVGNHSVGKVAAGRDPSTPGRKKLESIFRRRDVKVVKSADAWYRLGRDVKMGEQPVKTVALVRRPDDEDMHGGWEERAGTNLFTEDQTEIYESPPIVNGRVPKNSFGNVDVFVPSMVPRGGVHLPHEEASRAARILGIDYAEALIGFEFRGRHGTAVLRGVVVASDYREAVEAVIDGFRDERVQAEEDRKALVAVRMWKRFLFSLRIKERIDSYRVDGDGEPAEEVNDTEIEAQGEDSGMDTEEYDDEEAGGFFPE